MILYKRYECKIELLLKQQYQFNTYERSIQQDGHDCPLLLTGEPL